MKRGPPQRWDDPVMYMPRCHNKVADGLADLTMDRQCSWHHRFDTMLNLHEANIVVQTDGGLRGEEFVHMDAADLALRLQV